MVNNNGLMLQEAKEIYNDTSYQTGYKIGQELYGRISISMIYSCKAYFNMMDTFRNSALRILNKDSISAAISHLNKSAPKIFSDDYFTQRGMMYFQIGNLDDALKDFDRALQLNQYASQSIYFKAWTLEIMKNYEEAYLLYSRVAKLTGKSQFKIFAALADKKKNGL